MKRSALALVAVCLAARVASAQVGPVPSDPAPVPSTSIQTSAAAALADAVKADSRTDTAAPAPRVNLNQPSFLGVFGRDVGSFMSADTLKIVGAFAVAGAVAHPFDAGTVEDSNEYVPGRLAKAGNVIGSAYVQAGGAAAAYLVGRATGHPGVASLGADLFRAQVLTQVFVQGAKFAVHRERPDGSNALSFPSGHTASAFATATIIEDHYGWKAGVPAYALAGVVAASRMASQKHYLSDVLVGAGIGIAAGKTISMRVGKERFAVGAAPTAGGAMVTFTRSPKH